MIKFQNNICFLAKDNIYSSDTEGKIDIILSPHYYWYFEKKLPISDVKKAKRMIPQMVASSVPKKEFEYVVVQQKDDKNTFDVFAVDVSLIKEKLDSLNIKYENISNISFFHLEFANIALELNESIVLKNSDGVLELKKEKIDLEAIRTEPIEKILENKKSLIFKYPLGKSSLIQNTLDFFDEYFMSLIIIMILILSSSLIYGLSNYQLVSKYGDKTSSLMESQKYVEHQVQLKYILDSLLDLDAKQKTFRLELNDILLLNSNKDIFFKVIEYDDSYWFVKLKASSKESADNFLNPKGFHYFNEENKLFIYEKKK